MLAGSRRMLCTRCVKETWDTRHRRLHDPTSPEDCDFCQRSIVEVKALYDRPDAKLGAIHICEGCLDLSMGVLRREEVDNFLKDFC